MALGALAANPNCGVKVVPVGMNYFHAHKFRSRAVVEFGNAVEIPDELVEMYKKGDRREAIGRVLDTVYQALVAVTVTSPDYDTLMVCRRKDENQTLCLLTCGPVDSSCSTVIQPKAQKTTVTYGSGAQSSPCQGLHEV